MATDSKNKVLNVPPLRFPEFTGEWERKALGDIGETIIGLTYSPSDVVPSDGTIVFRSSNIQGGQIDYSDLVRVCKNIKEKIITLENDILVCARNGSARLIGKNAILKQSDAGNTFGAFMMVYRSSDNPFIHPMLSTRRYYSQVGENLGARINQITTSDFNGFEFFFPKDKAERNKIAKIFRLLDERITTQSRIIDKLQSLMSGIVVTHFHKCHDKNTIAIKDLGEDYSVGNLSKEDLSEDGEPCILYGELFTTYGCVANDIQSRTNKYVQATLSKAGDLLFPASTTVDAISLIAPTALHPDGVYVAGDMFGIHITPQYNSEYISYLFNYVYNRKLSKYAQGSTIIHLHYADIKNVTIQIPRLEEQNKCAKLLESMQMKLVCAKRLIDCYQTQRDYLLQQMFI